MFCQDTKLLAPKGRNSSGVELGLPRRRGSLRCVSCASQLPHLYRRIEPTPSALGSPAREVRLHPTEQPRKTGAVSSYHAKSGDASLARTAKGEGKDPAP